jgi:hypothetical protein
MVPSNDLYVETASEFSCLKKAMFNLELYGAGFVASKVCRVMIRIKQEGWF